MRSSRRLQESTLATRQPRDPLAHTIGTYLLGLVSSGAGSLLDGLYDILAVVPRLGRYVRCDLLDLLSERQIGSYSGDKKGRDAPWQLLPLRCRPQSR
jgi:hypothetical protein